MQKNDPYQTEEHQQHSFWSGLTLGALAAGSALYLFGTKKGRETVRNLLDAVEDLDEFALEELDLIKKDSLNEANKSSYSDIHSVIDKIPSVLPTKEVKKYFVKDGKLMK